MLITPAALDAAFLGFDTQFNQFFEQTPTVWQKLATPKTSTHETEVYPWLALTPEMREFVGERQIVNLSTRMQELTNKLFESTFGIDRTKFEDDTYDIYSEDSIRHLAQTAAQWPDQQLAAAMLAGTTVDAFDGQPFFNTSHPQDMDNPSSPVQSNHITGDTFDSDHLAANRAAMMAFKAENGVPLQVVPNVIVVPPALEHQAKVLMNAETIAVPVNSGTGVSPGGAAAQTNVLKGTMDVVTFHRLAGNDKTYYLLDTTRAVKPFIWQVREAPEFTYLNKPDDPEAFMRDLYLYGVRARGVAGYGPWYAAMRVDLA